MNKRFSFLLVAGTMLALSGCINQDYDLSNIDTTSRIPISNLTVPVNLDAVTLDCVLDLSDSSKVKKFENEYAFSDNGTFESEPIIVERFSTDPTQSSSELSEFNITSDQDGFSAPDAQRVRVGHGEIPQIESTFSMESFDVDKAVITIDSVMIETHIDLSLRFPNLGSYVKYLELEGLKIQFTKGLKATVSPQGTYDPVTGVITVGNVTTTNDLTYTLRVNIETMDANKAGVFYDNAEHHFLFEDNAYVKEGIIAAYSDQLKSGVTVLPTKGEYLLDVSTAAALVTEFSGDIKYDVTGINIDPIEMKDLPELLTDEETNIILTNPQIYLSLNNPMIEAGHNTTVQTGISLTGHDTYATDDDAIRLTRKDNRLVVSPADPVSRIEGYEDAGHVEFADLGKILSGKGIPETVSIDIVSPMVPRQNIKNFKMGQGLNKVNGSWSFHAPLALTGSSNVKYTKEWNDWGSEDLDNLTIENATVTAVLTSSVPLNLDLTFKMTGQEGGLSGDMNVEADSQGKAIEMSLSGQTLRKLTGLTIDARINGNGKTLAPDQEISIKEIRMKLNGYYEKEF